MMATGRCELCLRAGVDITRHHLIPRMRHAKARVRKKFDRDERNQLALLCRPCHKFIHSVLSEKEMEERFHTVAALILHPEIARFVEWLATKPAGLRVTVRRPKA